MPRCRCVIWLEIEEIQRKTDLAEAIINDSNIRKATIQTPYSQSQVFEFVFDGISRITLPTKDNLRSKRLISAHFCHFSLNIGENLLV
ncbi:hypothetical protein BFP76_11010 [Amylibacter kogurei]|uniref:Uncharacterized protein n=1 Tax=Paramylibacter kogurei TaxID=1889778 RepID=A0A2G5KDT8_9RHOB|nr:hypothetical protein BFP76_11010 [Amylibacter kogurei]